jgi:hypothetical protein
VELEFKLPNEKAQNQEERKGVATRLYDDIKKDPSKIQSFADNKSSENVFYQEYTQKSLLELPNLYTENQEMLNKLENGALSDIIEGTYGIQQYTDENGELAEESVNGYTFFRLVDKETQERKEKNLNDIVEVSKKLGLEINNELDVQNSNQGIESGDYKIADTTLKFNNGTIYDNQEAYKVKILAYQPKLDGLT